MKKPSWIDEFKTFLMRGNVIDLAVGVVIGAAFTAIVTAVVNDIINPIITLISGKGTEGIAAVKVGIFPIGDLISAVINFLLISFIVFWMVKVINGLPGSGQEEGRGSDRGGGPRTLCGGSTAHRNSGPAEGAEPEVNRIEKRQNRNRMGYAHPVL